MTGSISGIAAVAAVYFLARIMAMLNAWLRPGVVKLRPANRMRPARSFHEAGKHFQKYESCTLLILSGIQDICRRDDFFCFSLDFGKEIGHLRS